MTPVRGRGTRWSVERIWTAGGAGDCGAMVREKSLGAVDGSGARGDGLVDGDRSRCAVLDPRGISVAPVGFAIAVSISLALGYLLDGRELAVSLELTVPVKGKRSAALVIRLSVHVCL
jgi:hypothetical protein